MNFNTVDPVLRGWAAANRLPLSTHYQDVEVRSFEMAGRSGRAQIWVEVNETVTVYVWDYRKRKQSFASDGSTLGVALDQALQVARAWCGHP